METGQLIKEIYPYADIGVPNKIDFDRMFDELMDAIETEFIRISDDKDATKEELLDGIERQNRRFILLKELIKRRNNGRL